MPKKTKKEKIIAEYRRKLTTIHEQPVRTYTFQAKPTIAAQTVTQSPPVNHLIRKDLVKTLILATGAVAGEVVLSRFIK